MKKRSKKDLWADFMKEAAHAYDTKEPVEGFMERMQDAGFDLDHWPVNLNTEREQVREVALYFNKVCNQKYDVDKIHQRKIYNLIADILKKRDVITVKAVILMLYYRWRETTLANNLRLDVIFSEKYWGYEAQLPDLNKAKPKSTLSADVHGRAPVLPGKPILSPQEQAENKRMFIWEGVVEVSQIDLKKENLVDKMAIIGVVYSYFDFHYKNCFTETLINQASLFSIKYSKNDNKIEYRCYYQYYLLKSLFREKKIRVIEQMIKMEHFI